MHRSHPKSHPSMSVLMLSWEMPVVANFSGHYYSNKSTNSGPFLLWFQRHLGVQQRGSMCRDSEETPLLVAILTALFSSYLYGPSFRHNDSCLQRPVAIIGITHDYSNYRHQAVIRSHLLLHPSSFPASNLLPWSSCLIYYRVSPENKRNYSFSN